MGTWIQFLSFSPLWLLLTLAVSDLSLNLSLSCLVLFCVLLSARKPRVSLLLLAHNAPSKCPMCVCDI